MKEYKSFGVALALWFVFGGLGAHRVYIREKMSVLLWYWIVTVVTFGIFPLVDAFLISGKVKEENEHRYYKEKGMERAIMR